MAGDTFGHTLQLTTFGESHGRALGAVLSGMPSGIAVDEDFIQSEMDRRRPGRDRFSTQRQEADRLEILSGVFDGMTTGAPIGMMILNSDQRSRDYDELKELLAENCRNHIRRVRWTCTSDAGFTDTLVYDTKRMWAYTHRDGIKDEIIVEGYGDTFVDMCHSVAISVLERVYCDCKIYSVEE